ncbi:MAG: hypothetical protein BWX68_02817 [Verrucomicrobia bacterium ADurb.Bin063]|nr:MAG: hypothetical protein BWX68_02817 [Verrucomicrobia bacterium ADurb.Bin063]
MATVRFSRVKYWLATRCTSAAVTACIFGPASLISRQWPAPSLRMRWSRIG